ncbi:hypothetical protein WN944_010264 [Citrus x changshan-huyou]|uniref:Uncharacterized protein n=1 Tax=Citrus x changshan-huyou TaxID=2935761 RepID=A0AAP0MRB6_9ROSI
MIACSRKERESLSESTVIAITSVSLLPLQNLDDLTPTYFIRFLKAMVPGLLMTVYEVAINQLYDVAIDKVNKPNLPLTSGDLSMRTGIAIASSSLLMSLAMGIMHRSPPFLLALIIWFLLGSAYSVDKYVLGRPIAITRTLMFAVAIKCCFCFVISVLKDIPDEDGDREFGIRTLSVILGKESVLWLCVYVLFIAYGAAVIVGLTSSPYLLSKLVTAQTVDLSSKASTLSFYMFIWKFESQGSRLCWENLCLPVRAGTCSLGCGTGLKVPPTVGALPRIPLVGVVYLCLVDYGYRGNSKVVKPLSILEDDGEVVSLDKSIVMLGKRQMRNYLVGKILTNKKVNTRGCVRAVILNVWKTGIALFLEKQTGEIEKVQVKKHCKVAINEEKSGGKKAETQNRPIIAKRLASELDEKRLASREAKRTKIDSLRENFAYVSLGAKQKLNMEVESQEEEIGELMLERLGTGERPTFREAQRMLRMHKPKLVFFCETKLTSRQMQEKCQKLNFENCFEKLLEMYRDPWTPRYVPEAPHMDTLKKMTVLSLQGPQLKNAEI